MRHLGLSEKNGVDGTKCEKVNRNATCRAFHYLASAKKGEIHPNFRAESNVLAKYSVDRFSNTPTAVKSWRDSG